MNIFYLDEDVNECAKMHVDKHCVKMILEYAQLMSTAHRVLDGEPSCDSLYKATHVNHPSAVWVRQSDANYVWLYNLWLALMAEYTYRYGRHHACERLIDVLFYPPANIQSSSFAEPPCCMPDIYNNGSAVDSYRQYYLMEKSHIFAWKNRPVPAWTIL
jgi:hypothetical protein